MNKQLFERNPRDYALSMVEDGLISYETLARVLIVSMSHDDVRKALDSNELSPRFDESEEDED